jgi:hypothetical protein
MVRNRVANVSTGSEDAMWVKLTSVHSWVSRQRARHEVLTWGQLRSNMIKLDERDVNGKKLMIPRSVER